MREVMNAETPGSRCREAHIAQTRAAVRPLDAELDHLGLERRAFASRIVTALFCLQIGFTAYAPLSLPQVAEAFRTSRIPRLAATEELAEAIIPSRRS